MLRGKTNCHDAFLEIVAIRHDITIMCLEICMTTSVDIVIQDGNGTADGQENAIE